MKSLLNLKVQEPLKTLFRTTLLYQVVKVIIITRNLEHGVKVGSVVFVLEWYISDLYTMQQTHYLLFNN